MAEKTQTDDVISETGGGPQGAAVDEAPLEKAVCDQKWERKFRLLSEFKAQHGHCNISPHDKEHRGLLTWGAVQRTARKDGVLDAGHARRLDELGFDWTIADVPDAPDKRRENSEQNWRQHYEEMIAYKARFGHCDVPAHWKENMTLATWVTRQRQLKKTGALDVQRRQMLEEAGFNWSSKKTEIDRKWNRRFQQLVDYKQKFGNCNVPCKWDQDRPFSHWVHNQRSFRHYGWLSEERIQKLDEIGFLWHGVARISFSNVEIWNRRYAQLTEFHKRFGHCEVPGTWTENPPLARWVGVQRALHSTGKLDEKRRQRLDALGFAWREPRLSKDLRWERRFQELLKYKERFGNCQVPVSWKENHPLGHWVEIQRAWHRKGKVRADRVARLEEIGFQWKVARYFNGSLKDHWQNRCAELEDFKRRFGHYDVPTDWPDNPGLAKWVMRQRREMLHGPISEDRKRRLEAMGLPPLRSHFVPDEQWEQRFRELLDYKARLGDCNVPRKWKENVPLGHWVENQRAFRRKGKLSTERIRRLDEAGMEWERGSQLIHAAEATWEQRFSELADFKQRFGHCNVPKGWAENRKLGTWVSQQRTACKKGYIREERKKRLDDLGFTWNAIPHRGGPRARESTPSRCIQEREERWNLRFKQLEDYKERFGNCHVPARWKEDMALARWADKQRLKHRQGRISQQHLQRLNDLGFRWYGIRERRPNLNELPVGMLNGCYPPTPQWERRFAELVAFKDRFGHSNVPERWKESRSLGIWAGNQRIVERQGRLHPEKRRRLDELGFRWSKPARSPSPGWEHHFAQLIEFKNRFGHCNVPRKFPENPSLAGWVSNQRHYWVVGKLKAERIRRFEEIGFARESGRFKLPRAGSWERRFAELKDFKNRFGHTEVPSRWPDFRDLCAWIHAQRRAFAAGKLAADRKRGLDELGFDWTSGRRARDAQSPPRNGPCLWEWRFEELKAYRRRFGHCNVPIKWAGNPKLAGWVHRQRMQHSRGLIKPERTRRLDELSFEWARASHIDETHQNFWEQKFSELQDFRRQFGHCNVPDRWPANRQLGLWAGKQRTRHLRGNLDPERVRRLEEIGFEWQRRKPLLDRQWEKRFEELQDFHRQFGHCNVPTNWPANRQLGTWVHKQRAHCRRGTMEPERSCRLEAIGFEWQRVITGRSA